MANAFPRLVSTQPHNDWFLVNQKFLISMPTWFVRLSLILGLLRSATVWPNRIMLQSTWKQEPPDLTPLMSALLSKPWPTCLSLDVSELTKRQPSMFMPNDWYLFCILVIQKKVDANPKRGKEICTFKQDLFPIMLIICS